MNYKNNHVIYVVITLLFFSFTLQGEELKVYSKGAVLIEQDSGRVLFDQNSEEQLPMASTTKIMTCLVALEKGNLDDVVTVSSKAAKAPKVKLNLKVDEKQYLGDLLYSLMLESHNDTAIAIAEHIGGSVEGFCQMMTERAHELGATNTSFETPNGLDGDQHYTTARDLALITSYALKNETLVGIINTQSYTMPSRSLEGSTSHQLQNKNRFLYSYEGANGVKTGYTNKAGHCFVGAANKNDMELIAVALGAGWGDNGKSRKYTDVIKMMNYGFKNYKKYQVISKDQSFDTISILEGETDSVQTVCLEELILPLTQEESDTLLLQTNLPESLEAPVAKGTKVGEVRVVCNDQILRTVDLVCNDSVDRATLLFKIKKAIHKYFGN